VLDESVLSRRIGDEQIMRDQLTHLASLADRPNITIRILPLTARHVVIGPAFSIFQFGSRPDALASDVVASEQMKRIVFEESEQEAHLHSLAFRALADEMPEPSPVQGTDPRNRRAALACD
jgi:hypothetical protein